MTTAIDLLKKVNNHGNCILAKYRGQNNGYAFLFERLSNGYRWSYFGRKNPIMITEEEYQKIKARYIELGLLSAMTVFE